MSSIPISTGVLDFVEPTGTWAPVTGTPWYPRVSAGDFYVEDRHHYLYGRKATYTLEECRHTSFTLSDFPVDLDTMAVTIEGRDFTDFKVEGQKFTIVHGDPAEMATFWEAQAWSAGRCGWAKAGHAWDPVAEIQVAYNYLSAAVTGVTGDMFTTNTVTEVLNMRNGYDEYFVPTGLYPPVVITDDCIQPDNARDFLPEFALDFDTGELTFNAADNRLLNPAFCAVPCTGDIYPLGWTITNDDGLALHRVPDAYYGRHVLLAHGTGYCLQQVSMDPLLPHAVSAWIRRRPRADGGTGYISVGYIAPTGQIVDPSGVYMGILGDYSLHSVTATSVPGTEWERISLALGDPTTLYPSMDAAVPSAVTGLQILLHGNAVEFDAVQVEVGYTPSQFAYASPASTIELEANATGLWVYDPAYQTPFEQDRCNLNPVLDELTRGFLSIGEFVDDWHDEPVGKGGNCLFSVPTGEFIVYHGEEYSSGLEDVPVLIAKPPTGLGGSHFLQSYSPPVSQDVYALLEVGRIYQNDYEYAGAFTTPGGVAYPAGIAGEPWVGSQAEDGGYVINLTQGSDSGLARWYDVLRWRIRNQVVLEGTLTGVHPFAGIFYHHVDDGTGLYPHTTNPAQTEQMASLVRQLHEWTESQSSPKHLGISKGCAVIRPDVTNAGWVLSTLDGILVNGLTSEYDYSVSTPMGRNLERTRVFETTDGAADYFNMHMPIYALDYMNLRPDTDFAVDTVDDRLIRGSRFFAHDERWDYYCGPTTLTGVLGLDGEVYNYGVYTFDVTPPCTGLGRRHTPWAKFSGYNKLVKRSTFHLLNEATNEDITSAHNTSICDEIILLTDVTMYRDSNNEVHAVTNRCQNLGIEVVVKDTFGNYVDEELVHATALYGELDVFEYHTNRSGAARFTYTAPTGLIGTGVDMVSFLTRSPDIERHLLIDLMGCPCASIGS